jgi:hypothetical protein
MLDQLKNFPINSIITIDQLQYYNGSRANRATNIKITLTKILKTKFYGQINDQEAEIYLSQNRQARIINIEMGAVVSMKPEDTIKLEYTIKMMQLQVEQQIALEKIKLESRVEQINTLWQQCLDQLPNYQLFLQYDQQLFNQIASTLKPAGINILLQLLKCPIKWFKTTDGWHPINQYTSSCKFVNYNETDAESFRDWALKIKPVEWEKLCN